jgi:hypothetical protein
MPLGVRGIRSESLEDLLSKRAAALGWRLSTHPGLRADMMRADDNLLVTMPFDGLNSALAPVLHLRRLGAAPMVGGYLATLDHLHATATPTRPASSHLRAVAA